MAIKWVKKRYTTALKDVRLGVRMSCRHGKISSIVFNNGCSKGKKYVKFGIDENKLYFIFTDEPTECTYSLRGTTFDISRCIIYNKEIVDFVQKYSGDYQLKTDKDNGFVYIEGLCE